MISGIYHTSLTYYLRILSVILAVIVAFVMIYHGMKISIFVGQRQTPLYLGISFLYFYLAVPVGGAAGLEFHRMAFIQAARRQGDRPD